MNENNKTCARVVRVYLKFLVVMEIMTKHGRVLFYGTPCVYMYIRMCVKSLCRASTDAMVVLCGIPPTSHVLD